jgi:hypothetical protein
MKRFWHALTFHPWELRLAYCGPANPERHVSGIDSVLERYGFTSVLMTCPCGAVKRRRILGNLTATASASELAELRRMAGL